MKPCDCHDIYTANTQLDHAGIGFADVSFTVIPPNVELLVGRCTLKIFQSHFKRIAEWYLEDQTKEGNN